VLGVLLYPVYQAIVMRWWLGGVRLGGAAVASDLRIGRYYEAYLIYLAYVMVFSTVFSLVVGVLGAIAFAVMHNHMDMLKSAPAQGVALAGVIAVYVIYAQTTYVIYQVVVKMRLWQAALESMGISGYTAFDHVRADPAAATAIGEGLADALGAGGF
jgi:hypothetical protein